VDAVPTKYHPRPARCTTCGDVVLVVERSLGTVFGFRLAKQPVIRLEHADPAPDGELFDAVDEGCRRPPVSI
jgi:hypothetical protein